MMFIFNSKDKDKIIQYLFFSRKRIRSASSISIIYASKRYLIRWFSVSLLRPCSCSLVLGISLSWK